MYYIQFKRVFDIFFSIIILVISIPLLIIISLLIWVRDKGNVFVKDPLRIGRGGGEFRMYKFRTMIPNAHKEILYNPKYKELREEWEKGGNKLRIEDDIRITWLGKILRKTDLDEFPQVINVLKGDMSFVGPRPMYEDELQRHLKKYPKDKRYLKDIFSIRPGMTGIWQVSGRNDIPFSERLRMDSQYAKEFSFITDLKIVLKTPYTIISRNGAYE